MPAEPVVTDNEMPFIDFADPVVAEDPFAAVRSAALDHWIARTPNGYIVLRYDECQELFRDSRFRTSSDLGLSEQGIEEGRVLEWARNALLSQDGEQHRRLRRLAQPAFTPGHTEAFRPFCRELLDELVSGVEHAGRAEAGALNNSYSVRVICNMLGFPDDDWESVAEWSDAINQTISVSVVEQLPRIEKAIYEVDAYMAEQIERLRREPKDCLGSRMIAAREEGKGMTDDELISLFETLLIAGAESTRNQLSFGLYLFAKHPDQWKALADDPGLAVSATEELLRFRSPFIGTGRVAREDVVMRGLTIERGSYLIMSLPSANHDPSKYTDPGTFDITRFTGKDQPAQLSFGHGAHICIGAPLARVELQEALRHMPGRMPNLRIDDEVENPVEWNNPFGVHGPIPLHLRWDAVSG